MARKKAMGKKKIKSVFENFKQCKEKLDKTIRKEYFYSLHYASVYVLKKLKYQNKRNSDSTKYTSPKL